jgi:hypothetical protein
MKLTFSQDIRLMRLLRSIKQTYADRFVIDFYFGQPFAVLFSYPKKTAFVVWSWIPRVLGVFHVSDFTQICQFVIGTVSIYMVNLICRPITMYIKPHQTMRKIKGVIKTYTNITVLHAASNGIAQAAASTRFSPSKNARVRAIVHEFFEAFWGHVVNINPVMCGGQA